MLCFTDDVLACAGGPTLSEVEGSATTQAFSLSKFCLETYS